MVCVSGWATTIAVGLGAVRGAWAEPELQWANVAAAVGPGRVGCAFHQETDLFYQGFDMIDLNELLMYYLF